MDHAPAKFGWTPTEYCAAIGCKRSKLYQLINAGKIKAKKNGKNTIIVTPPREYLASLPDYTPDPR